MVRRKPTVFGDCIGISWGTSWLTTNERMPDTGPMREIAERYCNHHDSDGGFDRLHWLFPDGSSKFAMLVDHGRRSDWSWFPKGIYPKLRIPLILISHSSRS